MIFDIRLRDFTELQIELRVTKKRNSVGYVSKVYEMTPDLRRALCRAKELRKKNRGGAASLPSDYLFITKQGKPYASWLFADTVGGRDVPATTRRVKASLVLPNRTERRADIDRGSALGLCHIGRSSDVR